MTTVLTIAEANQMDRAAFVAAFGNVYEHSSWVAERSWHARPFENRAMLAAAMEKVVAEADLWQQLALLQQHPRLGVTADLTDYSHQEQTGAGLQGAAAADLHELATLNDAYENRFGFPFIIAVRGLGVPQILEACRKRLNSEPDAELHQSLAQVRKIAGFRLPDLVSER